MQHGCIGGDFFPLGEVFDVSSHYPLDDLGNGS